jgi:UDP-3-O-[3-hydroxymyristoyl] glucosamine N-acyltransferase
MYYYNDLKQCLKNALKFEGDPNKIQFDNARTLSDANENSICWIREGLSNADEVINNTKANTFICSDKHNYSVNAHKQIVLVENPRYSFLQIVKCFFTEALKCEIHSTAVIHSEAEISPLSYIGPNCVIGKCKIDDHVSIQANCFIHDGVQIGKHVNILANTTIGGNGFGYERNKEMELELFPHIGNVIIEDHVDIGANTCIDRGTLGSTIIRTGTKIDNLVHIAHNVVIGRHCAVIANSLIGGSTEIGDYSWIAPSVTIRDGLKIGDRVVIGMGSLVLKNVPSGETWIGSPAKSMN